MFSGGLVDQEALIKALEANQIYGAGLDVYPDEPRTDDRFFEMDNVTLLPHMGTE
jgi:glyoxylate reductase